MVIKTIPVIILAQHKAHYIVISVQPDLVRKNMRHEAGFFLCGRNMNAAFHNLRNEGHGTGQWFIKSMRKRVFDTLGRYPHIPSRIRIGDSCISGKMFFGPFFDILA